jgi:hypothetical protein
LALPWNYIELALLLPQRLVFGFAQAVRNVLVPGMMIIIPNVLDALRRLPLNHAHLHDLPQLSGARVVESDESFHRVNLKH